MVARILVNRQLYENATDVRRLPIYGIEFPDPAANLITITVTSENVEYIFITVELDNTYVEKINNLLNCYSFYEYDRSDNKIKPKTQGNVENRNIQWEDYDKSYPYACEQ